MIQREAQLKREYEILVPYALKAGDSAGRAEAETPHPFRTCFQRDRDRVIHSSAFRRLEHKTQVFINTEGDYYRTRLTHTLEAAQIARSVARVLRLNEDIVEAGALSHDLGHTPFGHAGQDVMNGLMKNDGGFEHNLQSLRIVDVLEKRRPDSMGLNLTLETREIIAKHSPHDSMGFPAGWPSLEGQLVDIADSIAYLAADIDDGLHSGILKVEGLTSLTLVREAHERVASRLGSIDFSEYRKPLISEIINVLVDNLILSSHQSLEGIQSLTEVRQAEKGLLDFNPTVKRDKSRVHVYLYDHFYSHQRVTATAQKAEEVLSSLFHVYLNDPGQMPDDFARRCETEGVARTVCDYISGMTDRFASEAFDSLKRSAAQ